MATARMRTTEPDGAPRIATLDILRGVAILGILFMNINDMGQSFNDPDIRHLGWAPADQIAWWLRAIFADGTARGLLEMLFGAGMVILTERIEAAVGAGLLMERYYWRNIVLVLFGLAHMFLLLWPGDILHTYGVAALVAFLFRRLDPRWLIAVALVGAVSQLGGVGYSEVYQPLRARTEAEVLTAKRDAGQTLTVAETAILKTRAARVAKRAQAKVAHRAEIAAEDEARSSTTVAWLNAQWAKSIDRLDIGELFSIWEATSTMLIGAALFRLGILQGARTRGFYGGMTLAAYAIGLTLRAWGAYEDTRFDDLPHYSWATDEIARLATTLGHLGLICLIVGTVTGARLMRPFAAAGRTALTIYVLQSIVCLWILFPPFGAALYGKLTWMPLMLVSVAIDLVLLVFANLYVRHCAIAPVEWAWRSIVEWRRLPFRAR